MSESVLKKGKSYGMVLAKEIGEGGLGWCRKKNMGKEVWKDGVGKQGKAFSFLEKY